MLLLQAHQLGTSRQCILHGVTLPWDKPPYRHLNLICADFVAGEKQEPFCDFGAQLVELAPHMQQGHLYAFPCPSHDRPRDLKDIGEFDQLDL